MEYVTILFPQNVSGGWELFQLLQARRTVGGG
jgi:hypothetical protein